MKPLLFLLSTFLFFSASAQTGSDYKIEKRDSLGYVLLQNGRTVPFDTAQVQTNLVQKTEEVGSQTLLVDPGAGFEAAREDLLAQLLGHLLVQRTMGQGRIGQERHGAGGQKQVRF